MHDEMSYFGRIGTWLTLQNWVYAPRIVGAALWTVLGRRADDHQSFDNIENTRVEEAGLVVLRIVRNPYICAFCLFIVSGSGTTNKTV